eukprot:CAMPEP_0206146792 /NCGR_PEP_ID=MMETSP1473-20131121/31462_1 /ASSEMBLY_ACC=CAM_ASM_001109 /TAXON_ID=1461547 /ORGANISM="Stichococcus sp, Strain RCC1054" /LENGTH=280 /DNA_ID=CAMNT_0053543485 /DNA_START=118 /DNA_END=961 /DNA_ORIENTATION=-
MLRSLVQEFKKLAQKDNTMGCASSKSGKPSKQTAQQQQRTRAATGIVSLRDHKLKALPDSLQQDYRARVIDAANNQLAALPPWLGGFAASLNRLVLSHNQLTFLPPELGQLTQLKTLLLDHNRVRSLSGAALSLPKLELLDVSHNQLETIPPAVEQLTALRQLRAQNNSLGVVASELGHCAALEELDVSSNSLVALPSELGALQRLQTLSASGNDIATVPPELLRGCLALQTLSLHDCPITFVELEATEGYEEFEQRRRTKFTKVIASNAMLPTGGMKKV